MSERSTVVEERPPEPSEFVATDRRPDTRQPRILGLRPRSLGILAAIVVVGVLVRTPGLGAHGLYYDDAWFALAARADVADALHMTVTTPGFTMIERAWILLDPKSDTWAQLLPLLLGVTAPILAYLLGRTVRIKEYGCLLMAGVVAVSPAAIEYSVRVKEYEADFVLSAVVLIATELTRRSSRSSWRVAGLVGVSFVAVVASTSTAPIVLAAWAGLAVVALIDRRRTERIVVGAAAAFVSTIAVVLIVLQSIPSALADYWSSSDRLVGAPWTWSHLRATLGLPVGGLAHGLFATPLPVGPPVGQATVGEEYLFLVIAMLAVVVFLWLAWPTLSAVARRDAHSSDLSLLPSVGAVLLSVGLFLIGAVPLGTGRTDLVLYPALLLLLVHGVERIAARMRPSLSVTASRVWVAVLVIVASSIGLTVASKDRSWYPSQNVQAIAPALHLGADRNQVVVVSYRTSFTWAFAGVSPWVVHFSVSNRAAATMGFWVTSKRPDVIMQLPPTGWNEGAIPDLATLPATVRRLWFVGTTLAVASPSELHTSASEGRYREEVPWPDPLRSYGWVPAQGSLRAEGVYAQLYVRR